MVFKYDGSDTGINNADSDGRTLMLSCLNGHLKSIQSLLALGTNNSLRYICMFCFLYNIVIMFLRLTNDGALIILNVHLFKSYPVITSPGGRNSFRWIYFLLMVILIHGTGFLCPFRGIFDDQ